MGFDKRHRKCDGRCFYSTIKNALNKANIKVPKGIAERIAKEAEDKFVNYSDISGVVQVLRAPAAPLPGAAAAFLVIQPMPLWVSRLYRLLQKQTHYG